MDEEFLPEGKKKWNDHKYWDKQKKIAETLLAVGYAHPPALIGLCEVENRRVLNDLVRQDIMKAADYRVIHFESPDRRHRCRAADGPFPAEIAFGFICPSGTGR